MGLTLLFGPFDGFERDLEGAERTIGTVLDDKVLNRAALDAAFRPRLNINVCLAVPRLAEFLCRLGMLVDTALGELGKRFVRLLFLGQRGVE